MTGGTGYIGRRLIARLAGRGHAVQAEIRHFIYVSVAQPAPMMRAYVEVRRRAEALIRAARLDATVLRPWYVRGPGHRWPLALLPGDWLAGCVPGLRESAQRFGLVTIEQMLGALERAAAAGAGRSSGRGAGDPGSAPVGTAAGQAHDKSVRRQSAEGLATCKSGHRRCRDQCPAMNCRPWFDPRSGRRPIRGRQVQRLYREVAGHESGDFLFVPVLTTASR